MSDDRDRLQVGQWFRDNDARMGDRLIEIVDASTDLWRVKARGPDGRVRIYEPARLHTDGKPRKSGFSLIASQRRNP